MNNLFLLKNSANFNNVINNITNILLNDIFFYNNICNKNFIKYQKNNKFSCPSQILINTDQKKYTCKKETTDYIIFENEFLKTTQDPTKCNQCGYQIKDCKINLRCLDMPEYNLDDNYESINNNITDIIQNKCF